VHLNGSGPSAKDAEDEMPSTDNDTNHPTEGLLRNEAEMFQNRPTPDKPVFPASAHREADTMATEAFSSRQSQVAQTPVTPASCSLQLSWLRRLSNWG
jgi:hypothetical protein